MKNIEEIVVGIEDIPEAVNARDLNQFISDGKFKSGAVEPASRARVIVFQSWLGVGDSQVLVQLTKGRVFSIDHGDAFGQPSSLSEPRLVITSIPGVLDDIGREPDLVRSAVKIIESITDDELIKSVACMPSGEAWLSSYERRWQIYRWLGYRRDKLWEVMGKWINI